MKNFFNNLINIYIFIFIFFIFMFNFIIVNEEYYISIGLLIFIMLGIFIIFMLINDYLNNLILILYVRLFNLLRINIQLKKLLYNFLYIEFLIYNLLNNINLIFFKFKKESIRISFICIDLFGIEYVINDLYLIIFFEFLNIKLNLFFKSLLFLYMYNFFFFLKINYLNLMQLNDNKYNFYNNLFFYNILLLNYSLNFKFNGLLIV